MILKKITSLGFVGLWSEMYLSSFSVSPYSLEIITYLESDELVCEITDEKENSIFYKSVKMDPRKKSNYSFTIRRLAIRVDVQVYRKVRTDLSTPQMTIKKTIAIIKTL